MSCKSAPFALIAMAMLSTGVRAEDSGTPMYSFSGFGTLGIVHSSENQADFVSNQLKPNGAGYTRNWSPTVDSLLGAQVTATFAPQISAVLQVISEQNYDGSWTPHVEWANLKYEFTPDFSIRGGRIVQPAFLVSDYRKVGYAIPWVRPPIEVYSLVPISNSDGVDATYRVHVGAMTATLQGIFGKTEPTFPTGDVTAKDLWAVSLTAVQGAATGHVTVQRTRVTVESLQPLFDGFRQFGPEGAAIADKYESDGTPFDFFGLGGMYDPGQWFVMAEWGHANSHSVVGNRTAWYGSVGYRIGAFTPYLIYAQARSIGNTSDPGLTLSGLPPSLVGPAAALNAGLNLALQSIPVQNSFSVGTRWDIAKDVDLKLQFDRVHIGAGSRGTLTNLQPGFQPGGRLSVFSATFDFVF